MLVGEMLRSLCVVSMVVRLLCVVRMMVRGLKLGDLHAKPLVGLTAIHHDMLGLVALTVHCERLV